MRVLLTLLVWCLLFVLCWPVAILAVVLFPLFWLLLIPFRIVGFGIEAALRLIREIFMLPSRLVGGGRQTS